MLLPSLAELEGVAFGYQQRGLLVAYRERAALLEAEHDLSLLAAAGGVAKRLSAGELCQRIPALSPNLAGGIEYPLDAHIIPGDFVRGLAAEVERRGVAIETHTEVLGIEWSRRAPSAASRAARSTLSESVWMKAFDEIAARRQKPANTSTSSAVPLDWRLPEASATPLVSSRFATKLLEIVLRNNGIMNDAARPAMTLATALLNPSRWSLDMSM